MPSNSGTLLLIRHTGRRAYTNRACCLRSSTWQSAGVLRDNEIRYDDILEGFAAYAEAVRPDENMQAYFPFYHLRSESFWSLKSLGDTVDDDRRPKHGTMIGRSATLDPDLHELMANNAQARRRMRDVLIAYWFPERRGSVENVIRSRSRANEYEEQLRRDKATASDAQPDDDSRNQSFRRLVLQAYDYRCAATGWRIIIPGAGSLVDAAHLIPFKETRDDRPCNGIALTPTYHRALDRHLIAPGLDMKWRVSSVLDKRIMDNRPFLELEGQDVIFNGSQEHRPAPEALHWRICHLLRPAR